MVTDALMRRTDIFINFNNNWNIVMKMLLNGRTVVKNFAYHRKRSIKTEKKHRRKGLCICRNIAARRCRNKNVLISYRT